MDWKFSNHCNLRPRCWSNKEPARTFQCAAIRFSKCFLLLPAPTFLLCSKTLQKSTADIAVIAVQSGIRIVSVLCIPELKPCPDCCPSRFSSTLQPTVYLPGTPFYSCVSGRNIENLLLVLFDYTYSRPSTFPHLIGTQRNLSNTSNISHRARLPISLSIHHLLSHNSSGNLAAYHQPRGSKEERVIYFHSCYPPVFPCTRVLDWVARHIVESLKLQGMSRAFLLAVTRQPNAIQC